VGFDVAERVAILGKPYCWFELFSEINSKTFHTT
jgi:hypothetical protein